MNIATLQRRRDNPLIICCLAVLTIVLCGGRSKRPTTASASTSETSKGNNGGGSRPISDFFSSLYGDSTKKAFFGAAASASDPSSTTQNVELSAGQLAAFLNQFKQSQNNQGSNYNAYNMDRRRGKSNRRKVLYDLSVRGHYEKLLHEDIMNASLSMDDNAASVDDSHDSDDSTVTSCEYYNDGMQFKFDLREMAAKEENIFSRSSHWTFKLCPKKSITQLHLEPSAVNDDDGDATNGDNIQSLKLPSSSVLSNSIQFLLPSIHNLGTYLSPQTPDYDSLIGYKWGPDEMNVPMPHLVEYYVDGDACSYKPKGSAHTGTTKRQSKVIYDLQCCQRRESIMEELFENDGEIMIRSTAEPEPCRYILNACKICPVVDDVMANETLDAITEIPSSVDPSDFGHLLQTHLHYAPFGPETNSPVGGEFPPMPPSKIEANKQLLQSMFTHAYDAYMHNAFPASELKPLTCQPGKFNLVKVPALTLIDTLDTLIIMGNFTEFARSVERLRFLDAMMNREFQASKEKSKRSKHNNEKGERGGLFSINQNVSLFETTIRVLGGLLSAHQMALAFMANIVMKSDVWDESGVILSGDSNARVVSSDKAETPAKDDGEEVGSTMGGAQAAESGVIHVEEEHDCTSEVDAASKKKKGKNSTSSNIALIWEYDGFLLELAHDIGKRLLPAFDTDTGIPYGTVNLMHGIPPGETPVASLAGAGTLSLEFELLSRLTGDPSFGKAAKLATRALWIRRSPELNLFGKHIDGQSGKWREYLSGVGSNSDSFYEYLLKHYILFPDDGDFWLMFLTVYSGVHDNSRLGEWYVDVDMSHGLNGHVRQVFESLMAFYPGLQVLMGELVPSAKTLNSFFLVREFLGLLPERFNFAHWKVDDVGIHPLRPELLESCYFLHLATIGLHGSKCGPCSSNSSSPHTSSWLWAADFALHAVHKLSWTPCGFATVTGVGPTTTGGLDFVGDNRDPQTEQKRLNIRHQNEMPSYFLSETIKYLYLTFDAENSILHRDSERDWVFTTEAHPIHYVPISNPTLQENNSLETQLDKVRSLLRESTSGSMPSVDESFSTNETDFEDQQWTQSTIRSIFVESINNVESEIIASKKDIAGMHDFVSGPYFQQRSFSTDVVTEGIFSSEISAINLAHDQFESHGRGNGNGQGKQCPNYHNSDLQWIHALHDSLDYNAAHSSSVSNVSSKPHPGADERMLTALASVCFYGTDYYADGIAIDTSNSCLIEETPQHIADPRPTSAKNKENRLQPSTSAPIPGATRYDMGGVLGKFDVSSFPGGDGFIVRHVNSDELLEVSIFHDDPETSSGTVILTVLTSPPLKPSESHSNRKESASSSSSSSLLSRMWLSMDSANDDSNGEATESGGLYDDFSRHVVVADLETNSFKCEVVITKKSNSVEGKSEPDIFLSNFPCSPAFFGKANMPNLATSGGELVRGLLRPPTPGSELGCRPPDGASPFDQDTFCQVEDESTADEVVQLVRRGGCNFIRKAENHHRNEGIIVINSKPNELFVMAGDKSQSRPEEDCSSDDLPVSVLVSGQDGDSITKLLHEEESEGNYLVYANILLTKESDEWIEFPHVTGSKEALSILARNGWGIHAVPQADTEKHGWQLFITQHNKRA